MAGALSTAASGSPAPKRVRLADKTSPFYVALLEELGRENGEANQKINLGTVSRVLPGVRATAGHRDIERLTKAELVTMVRDAFDNPTLDFVGQAMSIGKYWKTFTRCGQAKQDRTTLYAD